VREFMAAVRKLFDAKIQQLHQETYAQLLAGNTGQACWSAQRIQCLQEMEAEILAIYTRLSNA